MAAAGAHSVILPVTYGGEEGGKEGGGTAALVLIWESVCANCRSLAFHGGEAGLGASEPGSSRRLQLVKI